VRRADGSWSTYTQADGLASDAVLAVAADVHGNAWFGHRAADYDSHRGRYKDDSVTRLAPNRTWTTYNADDGPLFSTITSIAADRAGYVWFTSGYSNEHLPGVTRVSPGGTWSRILPTVDLPRGWIGRMLADPAGDVWFPSFGSGIGRRSPDGTWSVLRTGDPLISNLVWSDIAIDGEGNVWFAGGGHRLVRLSASAEATFFDKDDSPLPVGVTLRSPDGAWTQLSAADGLPSNDVQDIEIGQDGAVWFGAIGGVARWRASGP